MKVLVVDDDLTCRILLREMLKILGTVQLAVNGHDAVKAVSSALQDGEPFDLICLDIMMPEMDGHETLRQIRALEWEWSVNSPVRAKIIMTSALSDLGNVRQASREECDAYLVKPLHKARVLEQLEALGLITFSA
jgi:two-component system chemotaxis response regulator CheY